MNYLWDFGDGTTSTEANPSHTYSAGGTYTVTLTIDAGNDTATVTKTDYVTVVSNEYTYYGALEVRIGYDGDVGVVGYIPTVPLVQIPNAGMQFSYISNFIRNEGSTESNPIIGAGDPTYNPGGPGDARPMEIGTTNSFTTNSYGFYSVPFYFAVMPGDDLWITAADFPGYGQASTLTVEVGPYGGFREVYNLSVGSQPYEPITFSVTRTA